MPAPTIKFEYLRGKCSWARTKTPNQDGDWEITLHPDDASLKIINKWLEEGLMNKLKKDDDGYFMRFKRPSTKKDRHERKWMLSPPTVIMADGSACEQLIGNGSDVQLKIEAYMFNAKGTNIQKRAARLLGIMVENLVPYEPKRDFTPEENRATNGLLEQPRQIAGW